MNRGKYSIIIPFVALPLSLFLVFVILPYALAAVLAFTSWKGYTTHLPFNGLDNFVALAQDRTFWNALSNNGMFLSVLPPVVLCISLFFAYLFSQGIRGSRFFRAVYFFPNVMSIVAIGIMWRMLLHPSAGLVNGVLGGLGIESLRSYPWLGQPATIPIVVMMIDVWAGVGFYMILFLAAMSGVPRDLYDAAQIDGAGRWTMFFRITLPLLRDTIRIVVVFLVLGAMDLYGIVLTITNDQGGTGRAADVMTTLIVRTAFRDGKIGYATAIALVLLVITLMISVASVVIGRRERLEY